MNGLVWVTTSRSSSFLKSKFAQGLRGSLRSSTSKRPAFESSPHPQSLGKSKDQNKAFDDFHPRDDSNHPRTHSRSHRRHRSSRSSSRPRPPFSTSSPEAPSEQPTPNLRERDSGTSDISDLTTRFPRPPSHIPLPIAQQHSNRGGSRTSDRRQFNDTQHFSPRPSPLNPTSRSRRASRRRDLTLVASSQPPAPAPAPAPPPESKFKSFFKKLARKFSKSKKQPPPASSGSDPQQPANRSYEFVHPSQLTGSPSPKPKHGYITDSPRSSYNPPSPSWLSRNVPLSPPTRVQHHSYAEFTGSLGVSNSFAIHSTFLPSEHAGKRPGHRLAPKEYSGPAAASTPRSPELAPLPPPLPTKQGPAAFSAHQHYQPPTPPKGRGKYRSRAPSLPEESILGDLASKEPTHHRRSNSTPPDRPTPSSSTTPLSYASLSPYQGSSHHIYPSQTSSQKTIVPVSETYQPTNISIPFNTMDFNHPSMNHPPMSHSPMGHPMDHPMDHEHPAMDYSGKRTDVVDHGGEFDYGGIHWFSEPPPQRPQPSQPPQPEQPYAPDPVVIDQNEAFEYALSVAPNELYARYRQYGQLGVLAWCSEFGELIDNLKDLGFQGNMFVTTRSRALQTCEELLRLKLDVKMQIIIMYLSSQVARLRRFLDGDKVWEDYPVPQFPLEPSSYTQP